MTGPTTNDPAVAEATLPFELPAELRIDAAVARRIARDFIVRQLEQAGFERAVLALSGGIDSALVAFLVAEAIGGQRLLCVLMPYRTSSPASRGDAETVVDQLGCASEVVDISPIVDGYFGVAEADGERSRPQKPEAADPSVKGEAAPDSYRLRLGNFAARARMAVLYDHSVTWGGLVVGTGNKTETLLGYTTVYGDAACAFNPIGDLYKSQVRQLAAELGVPDAILRKPPSADLWPGQTDEGEVGFSYAQVDRLLYWLVDRRREPDALIAQGFAEPFVRRVMRLVAAAEFKRQMPPVAKLGRRTCGVDYLYPRRRPGSARTGR